MQGVMAARLLCTAAATLALLVVPTAARAASPPHLVTTQWLIRAPAGVPVAFVAHAVDPDGDAVTLTWAFDDGTTATGERISKAWAAPGAHRVTVTATDATGLFTAQTFTIEVTAAGGGIPDAPAPSGVLQRRPGPPAVASARVTIAARVLELSRRGSIAVPLVCAPVADCTGRISVALSGIRLASAPYAVRAGGRATLRVRLGPAAIRRLRGRGPARVVVSVAAAEQVPKRSLHTLHRS
jgi:PKD repeat protein